MIRLQTIAQLVPKGSIVADIGTDHAQLPLFLREQQITPLVYAIDNKPGPLRQAYQNTKGVDGIILVLANGIENLSTDVTTLVLAGMGGRTIVDILAAIPNHIETMVVSAHVAMPLVRETLVAKGFAIDAEALVEEAAELYEISRFIRGRADYTKADLRLRTALAPRTTAVMAPLDRTKTGRSSVFAFANSCDRPETSRDPSLDQPL
jgi:tRNA (adenine22-N1)-methyltransferase